MKHQPSSSSCPIPSNILPLPSPNENVIILASSPYSNLDGDSFTLPNQSLKSNAGSIGTSYYDNSNSNNDKNASSSVTTTSTSTTVGGRELCSDRRGFFDHWRPKSIVLSSIRITMIQAAQVLSTYLTDQIEYESNLESKLESNQISIIEYESAILSFEENEWNKRFNDLFFKSNKIWMAIGRFHILTLTMRSIEWLIWNLGLVSVNVMDKVTKDSFESAKRKQKRLVDYKTRSSSSSKKIREIAKNNNMTSDTEAAQEVQSRFQLGKQMFFTCFYANVIGFFADFTVQQCLLLSAYYKFYISKQRDRKLRLLKKRYQQYEELKLKKEFESDSSDVVCMDDNFGYDSSDDDHDNNDDDDDDNLKLVRDISNDSGYAPWIENEMFVFMFSFGRRSLKAFCDKAYGLFAASTGGAIGSMIYPGWGTLFGTQLGEAAAGLFNAGD